MIARQARNAHESIDGYYIIYDGTTQIADVHGTLANDEGHLPDDQVHAIADLMAKSLEMADTLRYIRDELTRHHFTTGFDHLLDRIDAVLPGQLAQDITEWCSVYNKRVVLVSVNGVVEVDPEFAKEQS